MTLTPGDSIAIASKTAITVPITGICTGACTVYGGEAHSKIAVDAGTTTRVPLPQ